MQEMHARMTANSQNEMIVGLDPITIGNIKFFGCKKVKLVNYQSKDESGNEVTKQKIDASQPVEYDDLTKNFIDSENNNQFNMNQMLNNMQQKQINMQLMLKINELEAKLGGKNNG